MTLAVYPPELNQFALVSGYRAGALDIRATATPTYGGAWVRGSGKVVGGQPVSIAVEEDVSNLARFWRFYNEELETGTLPFKVRDQMYDGRVLADEDGNPITDQDSNYIIIEKWNIVRFDPRSPPPDVTPVQQAADVWQIAMTLLVIA